jgi:hypothetical protein
MRPYLSFQTTATLCGAVLATAIGCGGDKGGGGGGAPDAAGGDVDAAVADAAAADAPPDTSADVCDVAWSDVQIGTDLDDQIWGLTADADRNIYAAGFEHGLPSVTNIEPGGNARGVVIKFDRKGAVQWRATLDTSATDTVEDVTLEPGTGRLYAVGRTDGAFAGFTNKGQFDTFLATLGPTGQVMQVFQSGDDRPAHPVHLNLGPNRSVLVAGYDDTFVEGNAVLARETGVLASYARGETPDAPYTQNFVQKASPVPFSINLANRITGVAVDGDGSGSMYVTSSVTGGRLVGIHIKKLNSDGTEVWTHRISPISADVATVAMSPTNEVIVTGATSVTLGSASFGLQDAFVMKMDKATGNVTWAAQAGSTDTDYPTSLAFDPAGNIYIAGETFGSVVQDVANQGGLDAFAMKFSPEGALLSSWQKGSANDEVVTSVAVDHCGNALVGGYSKGVLVGSSSAGGYDMFLLRAAL